MTRAQLEDALAAALYADDEARSLGYGWPVAEMASIAIRRWSSFARRSKAKRPTLDQRILDLANGLQEHFDKLHHDCKIDFIHDATVLAAVLEAAVDDA